MNERYLPGVDSEREVLNLRKPFGIRKLWMTPKAVVRHIARSFHGRSNDILCMTIPFVHLEDRGMSPDHLYQAFPDANVIILYRESMAE